MNDFKKKFLKFLSKHQDWLVIGVLAAMSFYFLNLYLKITYEQIAEEILKNKRTLETKTTDQNYEKIVNEIKEVPNPYVDLIKFNPFVDINARTRERETLELKYQEGKRYFIGENFTGSIDVFQELLKKDPFEARIEYKPHKPSVYIELAQESMEKNKIIETYNRATELFKQTELMDRQEQGVLPETLLSIYEECRRLLKTVLEEGVEIIPENIEQTKQMNEVVSQRYQELLIITYIKVITNLYKESMHLWNLPQRSLVNLVDLKKNLMDIVQRYNNYPHEQPQEALEIKDQVDQLQIDLEQVVDQRFPPAKEDFLRTIQEETTNLAQLEDALDAVLLLVGLRQDDELETELPQLENRVAQRKRTNTIETAKESINLAERKFAALLKILDERPDQFDAAKQDLNNQILEISNLPDWPELQEIKSRLASLVQKVNEIKPKPPITGVQLLRFSRGNAVIRVQGRGGTINLREGDEHPITKYTFLRITQESSPGIPTCMLLARPEFRPTEFCLK